MPPSLDDSTLDLLTTLKSLDTLILDSARLTLPALTKLQALPKLKKLQLVQIDVPAADVEKLRAALPKVTIDWKPLTPDELQKLNTFLKEK